MNYPNINRMKKRKTYSNIMQAHAAVLGRVRDLETGSLFLLKDGGDIYRVYKRETDHIRYYKYGSSDCSERFGVNSMKIILILKSLNYGTDHD